MAELFVTTKLGRFVRDGFGLWHYRCDISGQYIEQALMDALKHRPEGAAWFWWNGTFAPIHVLDTLEGLAQRYEKWRRDYQGDHRRTMDHLQKVFLDAVYAAEDAARALGASHG